ncbi:MAG: hypothetical protein PF518_04015 [Spirochaetaceae bacterium]|jgi:hypothetical protein|nr:hypothetical protein [Spirochaetaceae bacterium]
MNKNKTFLIICIGMLILIQNLQAYDHMWGARLDIGVQGLELRGTHFIASTNDSMNFSYKGTWNPSINIETDFNLLFNGNFLIGITDLSTLEFGYLGFSYNLFPELNLLNLNGNIGSFSYKAGRQLINDPGSLIVRYNADALKVSYQTGINNFSVGVGFTGLVFNTASKFDMTKTDLIWGDFIAPPRLFQYAQWSTSGLSSAMDISAMFLAQEDLTPIDRLATGASLFHSQYLEIMFKGFLGSPFLYYLTFVGQTGQYGNASILAGIGQLSLFYLPRNGRSRIGFDIHAATGDGWDRGNYFLGNVGPGVDSLNQYLPMSKVSTQGYVEKFELGNLISLAALYSIKSKSERFSAEFSTTTFLRVKDGPVSSTLVIDSGSSDMFLGQEGLVNLSFRPLQDFGYSFKLGVLYLGDPIEIDSNLEEYLPILFRLGLDFSISF